MPAIGFIDGAERLQRCVEGLPLQHPRLSLVEDTESRIDARSERVRREEPPAEAMDRGDPRTVEVAREIGPLQLDQAGADPPAELAGGTIGVGDDEQRVDVETVLHDRPGEPLYEHRRLAGAGAGRDERRAAGLDRGRLLLVREGAGANNGAHARSFRHMRQRSHHAGQSPPRGSCTTSPALMRPASSTAVARAWSISASKARSLEIVCRCEPRHLVGAGAEQPTGASRPSERHVDTTHRLQAELVAEHEQIQGDLQPRLVVDLGCRGSGAGLVVDDDPPRAQRICVDPIDLAADRDTRGELVRLEGDLELPWDERGACSRIGPHQLLEIAVEALTELAPLEVVDVDSEARVERAVDATVHERHRRLEVGRA